MVEIVPSKGSFSSICFFSVFFESPCFFITMFFFNHHGLFFNHHVFFLITMFFFSNHHGNLKFDQLCFLFW